MNEFTTNLRAIAARENHRFSGHNSTHAQHMRAAALEAVTELGLPHPKLEQWKYTDVAAVKSSTYLLPTTPPKLDAAQLDVLEAGIAAHILVYVDGLFVESLSRFETPDDGLTFGHISELLSDDNEQIVADLSTALEHSAGRNNVFSLVNTSFVQDGAFVKVAAGAQPKPVHVVFVDSGRDAQLQCPRLIVRAGANSRIEVIESHLSLQHSLSLSCPVTDIQAADGATVEHYRLQMDQTQHHIASVFLNCHANATVTNCSVALGGRLSRIDINADLSAPGAAVNLNGLFIADAGQHIDHHTRINHLAPHTMSDENYKGIAGDGGRGVFNGKIYVAAGAQKISATQSSKNLLLADGGEIDTKPELEIYADDVQCAHGATVGQLSEDEMFYLRSRGINREDARSMLTQAFVGDIVESIANEPLKAFVAAKVAAEFAQQTA